VNASKRIDFDSRLSRRLLIFAQILALLALGLGLQFLWSTTGGTVFAFSTFAPVLTCIATLILISILIYRFRKRYSLFDSATYEPGQEIFRQGDEGECAYFIRSGEVEVLQDSKVIAKLSSGQYFGETALIRDAPRNATVRAVAKTEVAILGKSNFLTMLNLIPTTQEDIMKTVSERASTETARSGGSVA
jgi:Cyclic nucleotide-binding domain